MKLLEQYGKAINKAPWAFIISILVVTLFMGYFSQNFEQATEDDAFTPDDEVSRANSRVQNDFGSRNERLTVLVRADNVLSPDPLIAQLELAEAVKNSDVGEIIISSPENPGGITSPAEIIVQSIFYTASFEASAELIPGGGGSEDASGFDECFTEELLRNAFLSRGFNLSLEDKLTILRGGSINISVGCTPSPVVLVFEPYDPMDLPAIAGGAPMAMALTFLLDRDYGPGSTSAGSGLFIISIMEEEDPDKALDNERYVDELASDIEKEHPSVRMITIGDRIVSEKISEASGSSMGFLFTLALVAVIIILIFIFRSPFEIAINVLGLFMAVIWVFGLGGLLGFENNPSLTTVPVLVMALGVDYGIHLTLRYREELGRGKTVAGAITAAEASVGFAIMLATVTTLIGFLSNLTASSPGIRVFGILSAAGIFSAFVIMASFVPAARVIRDRRRERLGRRLVRKKKTKVGWGWAQRRADSLGIGDKGLPSPMGIPAINRGLSAGSALARYPVIVISAVIVLTLFAGYGAIRLEPKFDFRDFLPDGLEITDAARSVVSDFDFSSEEAYILVEGDVTRPEVFFAIGEVEELARNGSTTVTSEPIRSPLADGLRYSDPAQPVYDADLSLVWHSNLDSDFDGDIDEGVTASNVTALYDALFNLDPDSAGRILKRENDGTYSGFVIRVPVNSRGGSEADTVTDEMEYAASPLKEMESSTDIVVTATGGPLVQQTVLEAISTSQAQSVIITFLVSLVILTAVFLATRRSLFLGLITLLPLIFVIIWTLGTMYYLDIPLNVVTVTISAITVGIGIDYGIHISQRFLEDMERIGDGICALSVAVNHTGSALFGSAATTVVGFAILSLAIIPPLAQFGQVTAISVTYAFLASVFVLPTFLLLWLRGNHWYRKKVKGEKIPELSKECAQDET